MVASFVVLYALLILFLLYRWNQIPMISGEYDEPVSVIIPFRNEEDNLPRLVQFLGKLEYSQFEIIFINDHSEDDSLAVLVKQLPQTLLTYRIIDLEEGHGKKAALTKGIEVANHDLIVTTDADCIMDKDWLGCLAVHFSSTSVHLVAGPVSYMRRNAWSKMLAIEFQALIGVTGALIQMKKPTMANGANLAFRKDTFQELNGYEGTFSTPSGDDELFMAKVFKKYPEGVSFAKDPRSLVSTLAPSNWKGLKQQRIRWASKWKKGKRATTVFTALLVLTVQMAYLSTIIIGLKAKHYEVLSAVVLLKFIVEAVFVSKTAKDIGASQPHSGLFALSFIIYPFYAIYIALLANFSSFEWKGRLYK